MTTAYKQTRKEKDTIGEVAVPSDSFYGIQSVRARENFPLDKSFHIDACACPAANSRYYEVVEVISFHYLFSCP